jgi:hypothetical protein
MAVRASGTNTTNAAGPVQQAVPQQYAPAPAPVATTRAPAPAPSPSLSDVPATSLAVPEPTMNAGVGAAQAVMYNGMTAPFGQIGSGVGFGSFASMPESSVSGQIPMFQSSPAIQQQAAMMNSMLSGTASQFMTPPTGGIAGGMAVQSALQSMGQLSPELASVAQPGATAGTMGVGNIMGGGYIPGQYGAAGGSLMPIMSGTAMDTTAYVPGSMAGLGNMSSLLGSMHNGVNVGNQLFGQSNSILDSMKQFMAGSSVAPVAAPAPTTGNPLMGMMGGGSLEGMSTSGFAMKDNVDGITAEGGLQYAMENSPSFAKIVQMAEQNAGGSLQFQLTDLVGNQQGEAKLGGQGAGGNVIKLDTNSESSAVDFLSTIIHEVIHVALGGDGAGGNMEDAHGAEFKEVFNNVINEIDSSTRSNGDFRADWIADGANGHAG